MAFHTTYKRVNIDENPTVIDGKIIPFTTNTKFLGINMIIILPGKLTLTTCLFASIFKYFFLLVRSECYLNVSKGKNIQNIS